MTSQTESQFQSAVIETAQLLGWLVAHFRPAQTQTGWRTPVAGDGAGFPDLVMVREATIYAELKSETGRLSPAQKVWANALCRADEEVYIWHPSDFAKIVRTLKHCRECGGAESHLGTCSWSRNPP